MITVGSPAFMAPEVALRTNASTDPASFRMAIDVYGLGCIVHDLAHINAAGRADLRSARAAVQEAVQERLTQDVLLSRLARDFEPQIAPRVPPALASLLALMLAVQPALRPSAERARAQLAALARHAIGWLQAGAEPYTATPQQAAAAGDS